MTAALRNPFRIERLPLLARLHRRAFRSGSRQTSAIARFLARVAFYAGRSCSPRPHAGTFSVTFDQGRRTAEFDARNRMFCALYFEAFEDGFEPPVTAVLERFMPDDGVFYDIGCNWGYHSVHLASRPGFQGRIHAFEPWPSSFRSLTGVVRQLELSNVVQCHNFAVGRRQGAGKMTCGTNCGCARLVDGGRGAAVQVRALDELDIEPPDVIKVDTEGHEEHVFRGAARLLKNHRPLIIFEHRFEHILSAGQREASLELLASFGYRLFLPRWNAPSRHGLSVSPLTIDKRYRYPECPDLLACHQDELSMLEDVLCPSVPQAA